MSRINEDIIEHILDNYKSWWPNDLYRLTLVSSVWLQPVRKRLYTAPRLYYYSQCYQLARTLEENPAIIPLIRALELYFSVGTADSYDGTNEHTSEAICSALPRLLTLTRLERLMLGYGLGSRAERYLRAVASPHYIKTLRIFPSINPFFRNPQEETLTWDGELSMRFGALESLTLGQMVIHIDDLHYDDNNDAKVDSSALQRGCMLKELVLWDVQFADSSGPLCSLLYGPASWRSLRALTFTTRKCTQRAVESLVSVLRLVHDSLESLEVEIENDLCDLLKDVPPLRRLRVLKTSYSLMHEDFGHITASAECLIIAGAFREHHVLQWATCIDQEQYIRFPNLRTFALHVHESDTRKLPRSHHTLTTLADACDRRGIEFDIL